MKTTKRKAFKKRIKRYTALNVSAEVTSYCQKTTKHSGFKVTSILTKTKHQNQTNKATTF